MKRQHDQVSLDNLGQGAAEELFQAELQRVIDNILDPNTKPEAVRSVTMKVTIKPNKDRSMCAVSIDVAGKIAAANPFQTTILVGKDTNGAVAREYNPQTMPMFPSEPAAAVDKQTGEVIPLAARK